MKVVKTLRTLKIIEYFDASDTGMDLKSIEIPVDKTAGGFIDCLRDKTPARITGKTDGEKKALLKFRIKEMVIVPFCSHNKVIGILGMDNITSKKIISPDVVSSIAIVANELGIAMENAAVYREVKAISLKDGLTGLLNRLAINELLAKSFRKAVAGQETLSLVMLDIDFFKKINDTFGHQVGDIILKLIATTLKKLSRPFEHVGRYDGKRYPFSFNIHC